LSTSDADEAGRTTPIELPEQHEPHEQPNQHEQAGQREQPTGHATDQASGTAPPRAPSQPVEDAEAALVETSDGEHYSPSVVATSPVARGLEVGGVPAAYPAKTAESVASGSVAAGAASDDVVYVPLAITIGDGFKFGCGFFLAFVLAALVGFVLLAALFLLTSLAGLNLPISR
jgi:hypothetical protein